MALIPSQRHLFDIPDDIAYFNCAYQSPLLLESGNAIVAGSLSKQHPWKRKAPDFFDDAEAFREAANKAFGTSADNFSVIPSASYGSSMAARIFEDLFSDQEQILVLDEAFPSNYLPWKRLSEVTGAEFIVVPKPENYDWTQEVLKRINKKTKLIALPHCHWTNGALLDLQLISKAARSVDAFFVLELTQSLGAHSIDLETLKPDFLICAGYKWLLCPYGLSLFYADPKWHQARPLEETWQSRKDAQIFENLVEYNDEYQKGARRFDMGQKGIPSVLPGGVLALEQIGKWGVSHIQETLKTINQKIVSILEPYGFKTLSEEKRSSHILGAELETGIPESLLPSLAENNVYISRRGDSLRFAPHLHINDNDLDKLSEMLKLSMKRSH